MSGFTLASVSGCSRPAGGHAVRGVNQRGPGINQ